MTSFARILNITIWSLAGMETLLQNTIKMLFILLRARDLPREIPN